MATTQEVTITLEPGPAEHVRRRMVEGHFASPSEYIEGLLVADMLEPIADHDLTHWMNTEGVRRLQALHAEPSIGLSSEEAFAGLTDEED